MSLVTAAVRDLPNYLMIQARRVLITSTRQLLSEADRKVISASSHIHSPARVVQESLSRKPAIKSSVIRVPIIETLSKTPFQNLQASFESPPSTLIIPPPKLKHPNGLEYLLGNSNQMHSVIWKILPSTVREANFSFIASIPRPLMPSYVFITVKTLTLKAQFRLFCSSAGLIQGPSSVDSALTLNNEPTDPLTENHPPTTPEINAESSLETTNSSLSSTELKKFQTELILYQEPTKAIIEDPAPENSALGTESTSWQSSQNDFSSHFSDFYIEITYKNPARSHTAATSTGLSAVRLRIGYKKTILEGLNIDKNYRLHLRRWTLTRGDTLFTRKGLDIKLKYEHYKTDPFRLRITSSPKRIIRKKRWRRGKASRPLQVLDFGLSDYIDPLEKLMGDRGGLRPRFFERFIPINEGVNPTLPQVDPLPPRPPGPDPIIPPGPDPVIPPAPVILPVIPPVIPPAPNPIPPNNILPQPPVIPGIALPIDNPINPIYPPIVPAATNIVPSTTPIAPYTPVINSHTPLSRDDEEITQWVQLSQLSLSPSFIAMAATEANRFSTLPLVQVVQQKTYRSSHAPYLPKHIPSTKSSISHLQDQQTPQKSDFPFAFSGKLEKSISTSFLKSHLLLTTPSLIPFQSNSLTPEKASPHSLRSWPSSDSFSQASKSFSSTPVTPSQSSSHETAYAYLPDLPLHGVKFIYSTTIPSHKSQNPSLKKHTHKNKPPKHPLEKLYESLFDLNRYYLFLCSNYFTIYPKEANAMSPPHSFQISQANSHWNLDTPAAIGVKKPICLNLCRNPKYLSQTNELQTEIKDLFESFHYKYGEKDCNTLAISILVDPNAPWVSMVNGVSYNEESAVYLASRLAQSTHCNILWIYYPSTLGILEQDQALPITEMYACSVQLGLRFNQNNGIRRMIACSQSHGAQEMMRATWQLRGFKNTLESCYFYAIAAGQENYLKPDTASVAFISKQTEAKNWELTGTREITHLEFSDEAPKSPAELEHDIYWSELLNIIYKGYRLQSPKYFEDPKTASSLTVSSF